jgi:hypothetical protein
LWVIAADVEGGGYAGEDDYAIWYLEQQNPYAATPAPDDPITASSGPAVQVSTFSPTDDTTLREAAITCTAAALSGSASPTPDEPVTRD